MLPLALLSLSFHLLLKLGKGEGRGEKKGLQRCVQGRKEGEGGLERVIFEEKLPKLFCLKGEGRGLRGRKGINVSVKASLLGQTSHVKFSSSFLLPEPVIFFGGRPTSMVADPINRRKAASCVAFCHLFFKSIYTYKACGLRTGILTL